MTLTEMRAKEQELRTELDRAYAERARIAKADNFEANFEAWCKADNLYMDALHAHTEIMSMILDRI